MDKHFKTVQEVLQEMESIHLENLKNPYHREFMNDTVKVARTVEAVVQNAGRQLAALEAAYDEEMEASIVEETVQMLTKEVYDLSDERSLQQTALKSGLRSVMGLPDAAKVAVATALFELMHKYDLHTGMDVDKQTAIIESFIYDVEQNHSGEMEQVGMQVLFEELKQKNEAVCNKVIERDLAKSRYGVGRMAAARTAADLAWRDLRRAINALSYINGYEPYADFIAYMNTLIVRYKRVHLGQSVSSPEITPGEVEEDSEDSENSENSEDSESSELDPAENIKIVFKNQNNQPVHEVIVPVDYQMPESEYPTPPEGTHWNFTLADLNLAIGMKQPGDTITVRAQA